MQIVWQPYDKDVVAALPAYCRVGREIWSTYVTLICFYIVEWYFPNHIVCQFRGLQDIPPVVVIEESLHMINFRGRGTVDWASMHYPYIGLWIDRCARVIHIEPTEISADLVTPAYVQWYGRITRRYISKFGAMDGLFVSVVHFC